MAEDFQQQGSSKLINDIKFLLFLFSLPLYGSDPENFTVRNVPNQVPYRRQYGAYGWMERDFEGSLIILGDNTVNNLKN